MRLTLYTDYSLRVLLYLACIPKKEKLVQIKDIAESYNISKNHLMKVIYHLGKLGYIETIRGRGGGIRIAMEPSAINIGKLVRHTEEDFHIVDCFGDHSVCAITPACTLKHVLHKALQAFIQVLDEYTLEDLMHNKEELASLLNVE
ncbi:MULTISPECIES: Rrf2 family transcriptional regulator [Bacillus]|uniref:Rrf2 family transcriptional regulator n=1 Tax=Bacillus TaxID=1386 RepID=UPI000BB79DC4|nr:MULTISPECIES: Rrf2 family transcriptional regulator [Bacillus]